MHTRVRDLIDTTLLPSVSNRMLTAELAAMRATVVTHLADARALLGGETDGGAGDR
jgi:hypothetical protein